MLILDKLDHLKSPKIFPTTVDYYTLGFYLLKFCPNHLTFSKNRNIFIIFLLCNCLSYLTVF